MTNHTIVCIPCLLKNLVIFTEIKKEWSWGERDMCQFVHCIHTVWCLKAQGWGVPIIVNSNIHYILDIEVDCFCFVIFSKFASLIINNILSSPELKALAPVVRLSVCKLFLFSSSSQEPQGQIQPNLVQSILGWSGLKFFQMKGHALIQGEIIMT